MSIQHAFFDGLAYLFGIGGAWLFGKHFLPDYSFPVPQEERYLYYFFLSLGCVLGAFGFGTLNASLGLPLEGTSFFVGRSVLGALVGAIISVEICKCLLKIHVSTGILFVPALSVGIAVGRIGCFLAGMSDYTYGIVTTLPWGHNFGDGLLRHPVQLYESLALFLFLGVFLFTFHRAKLFWMENGFALFALFYGFQRFVWEFLKPYPKLFGPFNLFHFLALSLCVYGGLKLWYNWKNLQLHGRSSALAA